MNATNRDSYRR